MCHYSFNIKTLFLQNESDVFSIHNLRIASVMRRAEDKKELRRKNSIISFSDLRQMPQK